MAASSESAVLREARSFLNGFYSRHRIIPKRRRAREVPSLSSSSWESFIAGEASVALSEAYGKTQIANGLHEHDGDPGEAAKNAPWQYSTRTI